MLYHVFMKAIGLSKQRKEEIFLNILILNGSPRIHGNTMKMIKVFQNKALRLGHQVVVIPIAQKNIHGCLACEYCHSSRHSLCMQKDDMREIYSLIPDMDMLILASPIYYHNMSGQLKCCIDRFYALPRLKKLNKIALFLSSGSDHMYDGSVFSYQGDFLDYLGLEDMGIYTMSDESFDNEETLCQIQQLAKNLDQ